MSDRPENVPSSLALVVQRLEAMTHTFHVAVIVDAARPYDRKIIGGVAAYMKEVGNWSLYVEEDPLQKLPDLRTWRGHGILANFDDRKVAAAVQGLGVPVVGVGGGAGWYDPASNIPYFSIDNGQIARLAAEHLLDHGFRRMAFYGYPPTRINRWCDQRAAAFRRRVEEADCRWSIYTGRHETARKWADLQRGLIAWLAKLEKPLGLLACNDVRARHVLEACRSIGLQVPEDVAVIGVDNDEMICELTNPPLSSIDQGARRLGYEAAALLDRLMHGGHAAEQHIVLQPAGVIARRSTDALAIEDAEIAQAIRFLREHACERIGIDEIARAVSMSRSSLQRRFKNVMGRTIHEEIERLRFHRAEQLLSQTELPLKQVAQQAGFNYVQYLTTLFHRRHGQTPREFRAAARTLGR